MRGACTIRGYAVLAALAIGLLAQPALAEEAADPLAGLSAVGQAELAGLSGRQGVSISDQDLIATTAGGDIEAGDDIETGRVNFGNSMHHGLNNQAINTGNNANVVAGMAVHIHLH